MSNQIAKQIADSRLSEAAGENARIAVSNLARAAACEELLEDGSHSEGQLYFLVRALCNEHGIDQHRVINGAKIYARNIQQGIR